MSTAEWTVMIFLNGDNNLEPFALTDFREVSQVGSTLQVNVVAQVDRHGGHAVTSPQWSGCYRFHIKKGTKPTPSDAVAHLGDTNMGSGTVLRDFASWAMEHYPAKRYFLEIWNHGQGWRFFRAVPPQINALDLHEFRESRIAQMARETERRQNALARRTSGTATTTPPAASIPAIPIDRTVAGTVRSVSHDDTSNDILFNREIQDSLKGLNLDVFGFDACLMAMLETAYAVRSIAKVMVGSEELEPGDGWNYADWLQALITHPEMNARDLGAELVRSYGATYQGRDETVTLSAVDLSVAQDLSVRVDTLARELLATDGNELKAVKKARALCEAYAPGYGLHGVDLARFCEQLAHTTTSGTVKAAATAVVDGVRTATIANYAGEDRRDRFGSHGLAIYFPARRSLFESDPDREGYIKSNAHYPVEFVQNFRWSDFLLNKYFPSI